MRKLVIIAVLGLVVGACGKVAEQVAEQVAENVAESQDGVSNVDVNEEDGTVNIQVEENGKEGSITVGGGDIPADFPIPLPDGGEVLGVVETTQDGEKTATVSLTYPADRWDELVAFFQDWADGLPGDTQVSITTGTYQGASFFNTEAQVGVSMALAGDTINVTAISGGI